MLKLIWYAFELLFRKHSNRLINQRTIFSAMGKGSQASAIRVLYTSHGARRGLWLFVIQLKVAATNADSSNWEFLRDTIRGSRKHVISYSPVASRSIHTSGVHIRSTRPTPSCPWWFHIRVTAQTDPAGSPAVGCCSLVERPSTLAMRPPTLRAAHSEAI